MVKKKERIIMFKKLKKDIKEWYSKYEGLTTLIIGIVCLFSGLFYAFILGFHNFDTAQNLEELSHIIENYQLRNNLTIETLFYESNIEKNIVNLDNVYSEGILSLFRGSFLMIIGSIFIGYGIKDYEMMCK